MLSVIAENLAHRLAHTYSPNHRDGGSAAPEQITVVVTDVCNLRCKVCQYAFSDAPGYQLNRVGQMQPQLFRKLMDEIPGRPIVSFTGGEPLLHPDVAGFIAYAKGHRRFCTLTTNGWMLEKGAQELCAAGLDLLVVSLDRPRETHNRVRGGKSFECLSAGLETILTLPDRPIVFVSMAVTNLSHDTLLPTYELARNWRVDGLNFNHLWMQTRGMVEAYNSQFSSMFEADEAAWETRPEVVDADQVADALDTIRRRNRLERLRVIQTPDLSREEIAVWYREPQQFVKYGTTRCA